MNKFIVRTSNDRTKNRSGLVHGIINKCSPFIKFANAVSCACSILYCMDKKLSRFKKHRNLRKQNCPLRKVRFLFSKQGISQEE